MRIKLVNEVDVVADALVHIDPEDDTHSTPARDLPSRLAVQARLRERFRDTAAAAHIEKINLHYIRGKITIELLLPLSATRDLADAERLIGQFRAAIEMDPIIASIDIRFH